MAFWQHLQSAGRADVSSMLHARAEGARRERVLGFADHELDVVERPGNPNGAAGKQAGAPSASTRTASLRPEGRCGLGGLAAGKWWGAGVSLMLIASSFDLTSRP